MPTGRRVDDQPSARSPVLRVTADDSALALETLRGDARSFEVLVDKYYKVLYNASLRMVNDSEDARDIVQNTFMKAYEKLHTYDPERKFFSWIYRIMIHESLNLLGKRKPREPLGLDLVAEKPDPAEACAQSELSSAVSAALMRLSHDYRLVVVLRHFLGFSYVEMSEVLGVPETTVKSRLYTARRQLGTLLLHRSATA